MTDPQYIEAKHAYLKQMQQRLKASLWSAITRRQYLLKMKAKYGGERFVCAWSLMAMYTIMTILVNNRWSEDC